MLLANNIEVFYHDVIMVLRGVTIEVPDHSIVAILGANGAGKSTTIKAISGLLKVEMGKITHGEIIFNNKRIDGKGPSAIARLGIIQVIEGRKILGHLTTEENLRVGGYILGNESAVKNNFRIVYDLFPKLHDLKNATSGYLSGGEQQMLVLGRALMGKPELIMIDEPSMGLAPLLVKEIYRVIKKINEEKGTSFLLVEQNALAALEIASYGYVMENGRVVLDGTSEKLITNEDIREFYLGLSAVGKRKSYHEVKHYKRRKRWLG